MLASQVDGIFQQQTAETFALHVLGNADVEQVRFVNRFHDQKVTEQASRAIAHLDQLKAKVMLIVGGEDTRVPPVQGENLHNALDKAHIAHEWLYRRTEGHGFYDEKNIADLMSRVNAFLDRNIGNTAGSGAAP